jgi:gliding motility-associated-like protein
MGLSFSPDNKFLYLGSSYNGGALVQYDLSNASPYTIANTSIVLAKYNLGTLQIGPDKKIYCAITGVDSLLVINKPGNKSLASNVTEINTTNKTSLGLPNIMNCYFRDIDFNYTATCSADSVKFNLLSPGPDSLKWDFGEPASKTNTSKRRNPSHTYTKGGTYTVTLITYQSGISDTLSKTFTLLAAPNAVDTTIYICPAGAVTLNAIQQGYTYKWQDNSTNGQYYTSKGGTYWAKLSSKGCHVSDTFHVIALPKPIQYNWKDTTVCNVDSFVMNVSQPLVNYFWQDSSTKPIYIARKTGMYSVTISNQCGTSTNSRKVTLSSKPLAYTWTDTIICKGNTITLDASQPGATYFWQDSSSNPTYYVFKSGTYTVTASNGCGSVKGSMNVTVINGVGPMGLKDTFVCDGDVLVLKHLKQPGATLQWQDGSHDSIYTISSGGLYKVTIQNACSSRSESFTAYHGDCTLYMQMPNAFSPDSNGINDTYKAVINREPRDFQMHIFDRWGERVFSTTDYKHGWDGKKNGQDEPEGVYIYYVIANGYHHENLYFRGIIHLVRVGVK